MIELHLINGEVLSFKKDEINQKVSTASNGLDIVTVNGTYYIPMSALAYSLIK